MSRTPPILDSRTNSIEFPYHPPHIAFGEHEWPFWNSS
jgi:hypothetical protein